MIPTPVNFTLKLGEADNLTFIDAAGVPHEKARPVRLFPLTDPSSWICIVNAPDAKSRHRLER